MRTACKAAGLLSLLSIMLWAFAGLPLWSEAAEGARLFTVICLHFAGLLAGAISLDNDVWGKP